MDACYFRLGRLIRSVNPAHGVRDLPSDMADGVARALTDKAFGLAIAQLDRFSRARGRTRGGRRVAASTAGKRDP